MKVSSLQPIVHSEVGHAREPRTSGSGSDFKNILNEKLAMTDHAATRIQSRSLAWDGAMEKRISDGIDAAAKKGSRSALILADSIAVIANVKTKTVVTAMDRNSLKESIFTNIDSVVFR